MEDRESRRQKPLDLRRLLSVYPRTGVVPVSLLLSYQCCTRTLLTAGVGLIAPSRPYFPDQKKAGTLISISTCSTSLSSVSTLCLVEGHSVILVKVFLITASYVNYSQLDSLAGVMAFLFLHQ